MKDNWSKSAIFGAAVATVVVIFGVTLVLTADAVEKTKAKKKKR
jgi:hypothetical protein